MRIRSTLANALLSLTAVFGLSGYSSCDPIIANNGFDLWCGEELCYWELDSGEVAQAPTWHKGDFGVQLIGDDVRLSQLSDFDNFDVQCLQFSLVADISLTADVVLQLDLYDDGVIDWEQPIPSASWAPVRYQVNLPPRYSGARFIIHKRGSGDAVLAQVYADEAQGCTEPPLGLPVLPNGGGCQSGDDCESGLCTEDASDFFDFAVCGDCVDDLDCSPGEVCGLENPDTLLFDMHHGCGAPARHGLGEGCISNSECSTGLCVANICSTCRTNTGCPEGRFCALAPEPAGVTYWLKPRMCSAGQSMGVAGEPCLGDADCLSGACAGAGSLKVCQIDGRLCDGDSDCPGDLECLSVGIAGGTCE